MLEYMEASEMVMEGKDGEMLSRQIETLQNDYKEAVAGGFTDMAETYQEKMKELSRQLEAKRNTESNLNAHQGNESGVVENKLSAHQGMETAGTESKLGEHQGEALSEESSNDGEKLAAHQGKEITFGSSDIDKYARMKREAECDMKQRKKFIESDISFNRDTSKSVSDYKAAESRYKEAERNLQRAMKNSKP